MPSTVSPPKERKSKKDKKDKTAKKRKRHDSPSPPTQKKVRTTAAAAAAPEPANPNSPYLVKTSSFFLALPPKYSFNPEKTYAHILSATEGEQSKHLLSLSPQAGFRQRSGPLAFRT